jgi:arylsulfatase A-like enzyme
VGKVLDLLERDGLASRTVVVFFGDNGQAHVRGKQFCYDSGLHVPMIVRLPRALAAGKGPAAGTVVEALVSAIDLAPTMLSIAGAKPPERMQGQVFLGAHAAPARRYVFGARDRCDETVFRFRTVRDAPYRYIRNFTPDRPLLQPNRYKEASYPVWNLIKELHRDGRLTAVQARLAAPTMPEEELYDTEADPHETENLASSAIPAHQEAFVGCGRPRVDRGDRRQGLARAPEVAAAKGRRGQGPERVGRPDP